MWLSDRVLRRWLATGRPRRVGRRLDDPEVVARLEVLSALGDHHKVALRALVAPPSDLDGRVTKHLRERVERDSSGVVIDLLGLSWYTASALINAADPDDGSKRQSK